MTVFMPIATPVTRAAAAEGVRALERASQLDEERRSRATKAPASRVTGKPAGTSRGVSDHGMRIEIPSAGRGR